MATAAQILAGLGGTLTISGRRKPRVVKPVVPRALPPDQTPASWPNPGTYDPTFDINRQQADRGYRYGLTDHIRDWGEIGTIGGGRGGADLATALGRIGQKDSWQAEDFGQARVNLDVEKARGGENYQRSIADLLRGYQRLGGQQAQQQRAAGVAGGGAALQAARKRAENQAWDRAPIDQGYQRFNEDIARQLAGIGREEQRYQTSSAWERDDANQTYGRGFTDALTQQGRNAFENNQYGRDMGKLAYASSGQVQPAPLTGAQQAVQGLAIINGKRYRRLSNGKLAPVDAYGRLLR